jgi:UDP-N-acetylmuramoyl-L-alanyl-D-glutamate--2,6-diaminopimelate ligase
MRLGKLLEGVAGLDTGAAPAEEVTGIEYDSRRVKPGTLFFAIQGAESDGHNFITSALESGAVGIVSERQAPEGLTLRWVRVAKIRRALATAARAFYGNPDSHLSIIGITGTNGKTTTAFLIDSILRAAGLVTGLFGTIEYRVAARVLTAPNTTPESREILSYFSELVRADAKAAVMEVSSHALAQERVWGIHFSVAVFTNLTRDHLDYHKDFENYFAAKRRLFEGLGTSPPNLAVINCDDEWGVRLLELPYDRRITYGLASDAQVRAKQFSQGEGKTQATLITPVGRIEIESALIGQANLMNILAATATAVGLGVKPQAVRDGILNLVSVPGRFERIDEGQPFLVIVDYAHTDDALHNVLKTARELTRNCLIVVFGCGGDRDRAKRPLMGEVAGSLSDLPVLTSDNPRSEDPLLIMNDVRVGLQRTGKAYLTEVDRAIAIRRAIEQAREGDVVVLAGKGHETSQIFRDHTERFDDRLVARQILRELGYDQGTEAQTVTKTKQPATVERG